MIIDFDPKRIHVQVVCGTLEEYKPSEEMKLIQEKVNKLREELKKFQDEKVHPAIAEIEALVKAENTKSQPQLQQPKKE